MKQRVMAAITLYGFWVAVFAVLKVVFVVVHGGTNGGVSVVELLQIVYHGLSLDLSMSGYLSVVPFLMLVASAWLPARAVRWAMDIYMVVMLFVVSFVCVMDLIMYRYWGFHFDDTVFFYLQNPQGATASTSGGEIAIGSVATTALMLIFGSAYWFSIRRLLCRLPVASRPIAAATIMLLLTAMLFLPIRGGVKVTTMNIGQAYFSNRMFLNHAAVNPVFNLFYSLQKSQDFASQYQFFERAEAELLFRDATTAVSPDSLPQLLRTDRPNIIVVVLESFSHSVALDSTVAPNLYRLAREGILFDNFYANSFRTDRGLLSILSGYPALPTAVQFNYPNRLASLPSLPRALQAAGYADRRVYYGGDIDFGNMTAYFVGTCGIDAIVSESSFPANLRRNKWGVLDAPLFDRLAHDLTHTPPPSPFLSIALTLSSHEPFDVPTVALGHPYLNSVHYTDSCLGSFIDRLKASPLWPHTIIICIADHAMQSYPEGIENYHPSRYRIPMVWLGGAVERPAVVTTFGSQNDLVATLLAQLGIDASGFAFSKNMFDPHAPKYGFYSYVNGFCMIDSTGLFQYDNDRSAVIHHTGHAQMEQQAKAIFQQMYFDWGNR